MKRLISGQLVFFASAHLMDAYPTHDQCRSCKRDDRRWRVPLAATWHNPEMCAPAVFTSKWMHALHST